MLVQQERGIKILMGNFDHLVRRFTEELEQLVTNPDRVTPRASAHHHAITHCLGCKAQKMVVYRWITSRREAKPNFWAQPNSSCLTSVGRAQKLSLILNRSSDE